MDYSGATRKTIDSSSGHRQRIVPINQARREVRTRDVAFSRGIGSADCNVVSFQFGVYAQYISAELPKLALPVKVYDVIKCCANGEYASPIIIELTKSGFDFAQVSSLLANFVGMCTSHFVYDVTCECKSGETDTISFLKSAKRGGVEELADSRLIFKQMCASCVLNKILILYTPSGLVGKGSIQTGEWQAKAALGLANYIAMWYHGVTCLSRGDEKMVYFCPAKVHVVKAFEIPSVQFCLFSLDVETTTIKMSLRMNEMQACFLALFSFLARTQSIRACNLKHLVLSCGKAGLRINFPRSHEISTLVPYVEISGIMMPKWASRYVPQSVIRVSIPSMLVLLDSNIPVPSDFYAQVGNYLVFLFSELGRAHASLKVCDKKDVDVDTASVSASSDDCSISINSCNGSVDGSDSGGDKATVTAVAEMSAQGSVVTQMRKSCFDFIECGSIKTQGLNAGVLFMKFNEQGHPHGYDFTSSVELASMINGRVRDKLNGFISVLLSRDDLQCSSTSVTYILRATDTTFYCRYSGIPINPVAQGNDSNMGVREFKDSVTSTMSPIETIDYSDWASEMESVYSKEHKLVDLSRADEDLIGRIENYCNNNSYNMLYYFKAWAMTAELREGSKKPHYGEGRIYNKNYSGNVNYSSGGKRSQFNNNNINNNTSGGSEHRDNNNYNNNGNGSKGGSNVSIVSSGNGSHNNGRRNYRAKISPLTLSDFPMLGKPIKRNAKNTHQNDVGKVNVSQGTLEEDVSGVMSGSVDGSGSSTA